MPTKCQIIKHVWHEHDGLKSGHGAPEYNMLRDQKKQCYPKGREELKFDLTGNMNRYVWTKYTQI